MDYVRIRFDITLSTEAFSGADHQGGAGQVGYRLAIPMGIYQNRDGDISWAQEPDSHGHIDPRMPDSGSATLQDGDLLLKHFNGGSGITEAVATLQDFTPATSEGRGLAWFTYMQRRTYTPANPAKAASRTDWKGKGTWELIERRYATSPNDLTSSGWTFKTAGGSGGGIFLAGSGGKFILIDPHGREWEYFYVGIGVGGGWKKLNLKGMTASGGPTALPNFGWVLKSPMWIGNRELKSGDMAGRCVWVDGSAVAGMGVGGALMFVGLHDLAIPLLGPLAANATVPFAGVSAGVGAGGGIYFGNVWLA